MTNKDSAYWKYSDEKNYCKSKVLSNQYYNKNNNLILCTNTTLDTKDIGYGVAMKKRENGYHIYGVFTKQKNENDWQPFKLRNFCKNTTQ